MVFNATFNNISIISWRSVYLVKEIGVLEENHFFNVFVLIIIINFEEKKYQHFVSLQIKWLTFFD
jgi:hypothetical protein